MSSLNFDIPEICYKRWFRPMNIILEINAFIIYLSILNFICTKNLIWDDL